MKRAFLSCLLILVCLTPLRADETDAKAAALADEVMRASGSANWPQVASMRFTFHVAQGDKTLVQAEHQWDVKAGTDTVHWADKTVTVNVSSPAADADSKAAYQRWVNDSYWLLVPFKLKEPGVKLSHLGRQELENKSYEVLHLSFQGVGLTPGDQYNLYVDPDSHLIRRWDYMPSPEKKTSGTWDDYREVGGLKLSLERQFGDKHIWFTDVKVETSTAK